MTAEGYQKLAWHPLAAGFIRSIEKQFLDRSLDRLYLSPHAFDAGKDSAPPSKAPTVS